MVCVLNGLSTQGCFDIMHAGHYNALRQAKAMFSGMGVPVVLVAGAHDFFSGENIDISQPVKNVRVLWSSCAGVHTDASIAEQKGPPVMNMSERVAMVKACKWVDEVVRQPPPPPFCAPLLRKMIPHLI